MQTLSVHIVALQSLTGKYREIQGKPCNENRDPAMRTGFPCNESRVFPVGIDLQGFPVSFTGFGFAVYYNLWTILIQWLLCFFIHIIQKCEQDQENCIEYKLR